jgi:hypothetical protein
MPVQREKFEQSNVAQLLRTVGGRVYVLGTRRRRGAKCPKCGTFVEEHQGTRQTPGLSDLIAFLPWRGPGDSARTSRLLFVECKAPGGRMSTEQREFREFCLSSATDHVVGDLDAVIAWLIDHSYLAAHQVPHYRLPKGLSV